MPIHKPVTTNTANLLAVADELQQCADDLRGAAESWKLHGFDQLEVVNFGVLEKAIRGAQSYVAACRDALRTARKNRGDFGSEPVTNGHAKRGKK